MVDSPPPFSDGYKNIPGCKKLSVFRHLHKTDLKFNHRLRFVFGVCLDDVCKPAKKQDSIQPQVVF